MKLVLIRRENDIVKGLDGKKIDYVCFKKNGEYQHYLVFKKGNKIIRLFPIKGQKDKGIDPSVKQKSVQQFLKELDGEGLR